MAALILITQQTNQKDLWFLLMTFIKQQRQETELYPWAFWTLASPLLSYFSAHQA